MLAREHHEGYRGRKSTGASIRKPYRQVLLRVRHRNSSRWRISRLTWEELNCQRPGVRSAGERWRSSPKRTEPKSFRKICTQTRDARIIRIEISSVGPDRRRGGKALDDRYRKLLSRYLEVLRLRYSSGSQKKITSPRNEMADSSFPR